ncbi:MAG: hypothetical protein M1828_003761 [Chrysothrix sp. TS-e1954]|nr:MAG: hypothetical protein M1828_003761 [Chrysothrix sp. TS-e1954]
MPSTQTSDAPPPDLTRNDAVHISSNDEHDSTDEDASPPSSLYADSRDTPDEWRIPERLKEWAEDTHRTGGRVWRDAVSSIATLSVKQGEHSTEKSNEVWKTKLAGLETWFMTEEQPSSQGSDAWETTVGEMAAEHVIKEVSEDEGSGLDREDISDVETLKRDLLNRISDCDRQGKRGGRMWKDAIKRLGKMNRSFDDGALSDKHTGVSSSSPSSDEDDEDDDDKDEDTTTHPPPEPLRSRIASFLPQLASANDSLLSQPAHQRNGAGFEILETRHGHEDDGVAADSSKSEDEDEEDDGEGGAPHIELDLSLGVLEEQQVPSEAEAGAEKVLGGGRKRRRDEGGEVDVFGGGLGALEGRGRRDVWDGGDVDVGDDVDVDVDASDRGGDDGAKRKRRKVVVV